MALTLPRWLLLAAAACATAWYGLVHHSPVRDAPNEGPRRVYVPPAPSPARVVENLVARTNDRLRLLRLRDSVVRRLSANPQPITFAVDPALSTTIRDAMEKAVRERWSALAISHGDPVVVAVVVDTLTSPGGLPRLRRYLFGIPIDVFLPGPETGGRCVALAHLSAVPQDLGPNMGTIFTRNLTSPETINALLSPCAYFAAFGRPGPHVAAWLSGSGWGLARTAAWGQKPAAWKAVVRPESMRSDLAGGLASATDPSWAIRRFVAPDGIACLAGRNRACRDILLRVRSNNADSSWRQKVVASSGTDVSAFFLPSGPTSLGPADGTVLSEMVRTLGRDRFAQFWTSNLSVDAAFAAASGTDLNGWVRVWGRRMYGDAAIGPVLSTLGSVVGAFTLLLGLGAAMVVEIRRRVA
jgi:hypothetical protein